MLHSVAGVTNTIVTLPFASTVKISSSKIGSIAESLPDSLLNHCRVSTNYQCIVSDVCW